MFLKDDSTVVRSTLDLSPSQNLSLLTHTELHLTLAHVSAVKGSKRDLFKGLENGRYSHWPLSCKRSRSLKENAFWVCCKGGCIWG